MNIFAKKTQTKFIKNPLEANPMVINDTSEDMLTVNQQLTYLSVAPNSSSNMALCSNFSIPTGSAPEPRKRRPFKRYTYSPELISKILELMFVQRENCSETARRVNCPVSSVRKTYQTYKGNFHKVDLKKPCNKMPVLSAEDLQGLIRMQEEMLKKNPIAENLEIIEYEFDS